MPAGSLILKNGYAWDLAFHPNGSLLMVSFTDQKDSNNQSRPGKIRIFDVASLQEVSPAVKGLEHEADRLRFRLRRDGRVAFGLFDRKTWDLKPDQRPTDDLTKLAQLYAQHRLDAGGGLVPLSKQEMQALWQELHAKYPQEFAVSPAAAVEWRVGQLQSASKIERPSLVAFHRRWLASELAEADWQPGERGNEDMQRDNYLQRLYALALSDRHAQAIAAADALAARWPKDLDTLYGCACVHALAAGAVKGDAGLAERYADRAVALLRQALTAGFNDGQQLAKDPDLDALRRRDDFVQLLWELAETP
jgi:hypothetical protein